MKKLDKLILKSFIGPFILTFLVVVFILLMVQMLKYFDDIIGKDLGWEVVSQLLFFFAVFTTPTALPLAILLSALITYGNLGEHFELTAIKGAGISLVRTLVPIFVFVLITTGLAFYINNNLVPKAALEAYSLLYDIKQKKLALDLREGTFYNGIPEISIKVDQKFSEDDAALKGVVVYDHRRLDGNRDVIKADSGRMYTILDERYLKFELYNGYNYREGVNEDLKMTGKRTQSSTQENLTRSHFLKTQIVFDLSSYDFQRTDKKWFQGHRIMRNMHELEYDIDSMRRDILQQRLNYYLHRPGYFHFLFKNDSIMMPNDVQVYRMWKDSIDNIPQPKSVEADSSFVADKRIDRKRTKEFSADQKKLQERFKRKARGRQSFVKATRVKDAQPLTDSALIALVDSVYRMPDNRDVVQAATNMARQVKANITQNNTSIEYSAREQRIFVIQWHKILASSLACIAMFLIGAPLGSIIKKGGLGVPFLVSILFFIIYYLLSMQGEKLAKQGAIPEWIGVWAADFILLVVGLIFLRQARLDARIFDSDAYRVFIERTVRRFRSRKAFSPNPAA